MWVVPYRCVDLLPPAFTSLTLMIACVLLVFVNSWAYNISPFHIPLSLSSFLVSLLIFNLPRFPSALVSLSLLGCIRSAFPALCLYPTIHINTSTTNFTPYMTTYNPHIHIPPHHVQSFTIITPTSIPSLPLVSCSFCVHVSLFLRSGHYSSFPLSRFFGIVILIKPIVVSTTQRIRMLLE